MELDPEDLEGTLASLLEAWRENRAPEIADAIDRVSDVLTENEKPITAIGSKSGKTAWYEAAKENRPAMMARILEAMPEAIDRYHRLDVLEKLPPDPRFGTFAKKWFAEPPVHGKNRASFYARIIAQLAALRDVRLLATIDELVNDRSLAIRRCGLKNFKHLVELKASLEKEKPKPVGKEFAAFRPARKEGADPASLFAAVYADLGDDSARAVLADLLSERGDPRGEFIALQLARFGTEKPRSAQERKLEQTWGRQWLGAVEPMVQKSGVVFERGFVSNLIVAGALVDALVNAVEWSTLTAIDVSGPGGYVGGSSALLFAPPLRNLRHVVGLSPQDFDACKGKTLPWETVGFRIWSWHRTAGLSSRPFPNAKRLVIANASNSAMPVPGVDVAGVLASFPEIEDVEIDVHVTALSEVLVRCKHVQKIRLWMPALTATFDRSTGTLGLDLVFATALPLAAQVIAEVKPARVAITSGKRVPHDTTVRAAAKRVGAEIV